MNAMKALVCVANRLKILCLLMLVLGVGACGPELSLKGNKVELGNPEEISHCRLLGNTRIVLSTTQAKFSSQKTMESYLNIEARNFAARVGGDTVLALGAIEDRGQIFRIYNCRPSNRAKAKQK